MHHEGTDFIPTEQTATSILIMSSELLIKKNPLLVLQTNPLLIRIETKAGHGLGKPTAKLVSNYLNVCSFYAVWHYLGLNLHLFSFCLDWRKHRHLVLPSGIVGSWISEMIFDFVWWKGMKIYLVLERKFWPLSSMHHAFMWSSWLCWHTAWR